MSKMLTIREEARQPDAPFTEHRLRLLLAQGRLPGVYAGNRFYVNHDLLVELADKESREAVHAD